MQLSLRMTREEEEFRKEIQARIKFLEYLKKSK